MEFITIALTVIFTFAAAELLPSNRYLPPTPSRNVNGYPQAQRSPAYDVAGGQDLETIAAYDLSLPDDASITANLEQGLDSASQVLQNVYNNGFMNRESYEDNSNANQVDPGYDQKSGNAFERHPLTDANGSENYDFRYMVNDYQEGVENNEKRQENKTEGEHNVILPDGEQQTDSYEADARGFKPQTSYENSDESNRLAYDSNANNVRSNGYHGNGNNNAAHYGPDNNANDRYYSKNQNGGYTYSANKNYNNSKRPGGY